MNKNFVKMFARQPDEVVRGDYFFRVPWYEQDFSGHDNEEYLKNLEQIEKESEDNFLSDWNQRILDGEYNESNDWTDWWTKCIKSPNKDTAIEAIFQKIAEERIPFIDIASGERMGFAPYIMKLNPDVPCLVTDIVPDIVQRIRLRIDEHLSGYNISLASFDNLDIPMKDNSIEYVTTICGISFSNTLRAYNPSMISDGDFSTACHRKLLDEVYRILKPGGYFVAVEGETIWDSDWKRIDDYFKNHDKLFGLYTYDYIRSILEEFGEYREKYGLSSEKLEEVGFQVEVKKYFSKKFSFDEVAQFFDFNGEKVHIEHSTEEDDIIHLEMCCVLYILRKPIDNGEPT